MLIPKLIPSETTMYSGFGWLLLYYLLIFLKNVDTKNDTLQTTVHQHLRVMVSTISTF